MDVLTNSKDLIVKNKRELYLIDLKEISYIEKFGEYCIVKNKYDEIQIRIPLKKILALLPEYFIKVNRSFIINTNLVSKIILNKENNFYEVHFSYDYDDYILINRKKINLIINKLVKI